MFNCYGVFVNGRLVALFKTENAAHNFIVMMEFDTATVEGRFIPGVGF
jgi:hypothetical protein